MFAALACSGCATALSGHALTVEGTKAHLYGDLISDAGGQIEYWAEYGPTAPAYGSSSPHQTINADAYQRQVVNVHLTGLSHDTTYHFRLCAQDSQQQSGPGCSADGTIHTVNLDCGDTITHDFVLSGNLSCESFAVDVLNVGADGIDINLGGHELNGPLMIFHDSSTPTAIVNNGHDNVTVRNGILTNFGRAISLSGASYNVVHDVSGFGNTSGIRVDGGEGDVFRRVSVGGGGMFGEGLRATKTDGLVVVDSSGGEWEVDGNDARILRNEIGGGSRFATCLSISGNRNRMADNSLLGCPFGDLVVQRGSDNAVIHNELMSAPQSGSSDPDGIRVAAFTAGTLVQDNFAHDNDDDGIEVLAPATRLQGNRADDNGDFGIDAVAGVTDLGGNSASGNGNALQCRNIFCASAP